MLDSTCDFSFLCFISYVYIYHEGSVMFGYIQYSLSILSQCSEIIILKLESLLDRIIKNVCTHINMCSFQCFLTVIMFKFLYGL